MKVGIDNNNLLVNMLGYLVATKYSCHWITEKIIVKHQRKEKKWNVRWCEKHITVLEAKALQSNPSILRNG